MAENKLSSGPITLRDFRVESINLIGANGVGVDIRLLLVELIVWQDIFTNYMHGEAIVIDGIDAFNHIGIHGSEYLYLHLVEPGTDYKIKKAFRVFKVSERNTTNAQVQRYKLHFVSEEMVMSNTKRITKAYAGRTISDIVKDILNTYLNSKKVSVEDTDDGYDIIIPNYRPTEALNWLASRATSGTKNTYLFYENLDGMNFRSLHTIYEEKPVNSQPIRFESKIAEPDMQRNKWAIDSFIAMRDFDMLSLTASGGTGMRMIGVDPFFRTITDNTYNVEDMTKLNDVPAVSNILDNDNVPLFERYDANKLLYLQTEDTSTEKRNNSERWISRIMSLSNLRNSLMDVVLPGNMMIQVGKLLNVEMPSMIPATTQDMSNELRSGNYLVVSVAHKFNLVDFTFDTVATLARDSFPVLPSAVDSQLYTKVTKINE